MMRKCCALWREGKNTLDMAQKMCVPEYAIANHLPHVLQRAKQDADWNAA